MEMLDKSVFRWQLKCETQTSGGLASAKGCLEMAASSLPLSMSVYLIRLRVSKICKSEGNQLEF
jgi:hypothetical protein